MRCNHAHGVRQRDSERNYLRSQLKGWFEIMLRDPPTPGAGWPGR